MLINSRFLRYTYVFRRGGLEASCFLQNFDSARRVELSWRRKNLDFQMSDRMRSIWDLIKYRVSMLVPLTVFWLNLINSACIYAEDKSLHCVTYMQTSMNALGDLSTVPPLFIFKLWMTQNQNLSVFSLVDMCKMTPPWNRIAERGISSWMGVILVFVAGF